MNIQGLARQQAAVNTGSSGSSSHVVESGRIDDGIGSASRHSDSSSGHAARSSQQAEAGGVQSEQAVPANKQSLASSSQQQRTVSPAHILLGG